MVQAVANLLAHQLLQLIHRQVVERAAVFQALIHFFWRKCFQQRYQNALSLAPSGFSLLTQIGLDRQQLAQVIYGDLFSSHWLASISLSMFLDSTSLPCALSWLT